MYLMHNFYIFVTALFFSFLMVPAVRRWAIDTGAVDVPGERKVHDRAVPRVGGIAIFVPFLFSLLVYSEMTREVRGILAGALVLFFTGLIDDLYGLTPKQKFFGQGAGCLVGILVGHLYLSRLGNLLGFGEIILPLWLAIPFSIFAVVGVTNAFNLIDGLDGLAAGIGVIALSAFFLLGLQDRNFTVLSLSAGLLGALFGFLRYNTFPARIFMGDTGSLVVGFVAASLAISLTQHPGSYVVSPVPLMILGLPIADAVFVVFVRLLKGKNPLGADNSHFHHKVLTFFSDHRLSVFWLYGISLFWTLAALLLKDQEAHRILAIFFLAILVNYSTLSLLLQHKDLIWDSLAQKTARIAQSRIYLLFRELDLMVEWFLLILVICSVVASAIICDSIFIAYICVPIFLLLLFIGNIENINKRIDKILLIIMYLVGIIIIFFVEQIENTTVFGGMTVNFLTNAIFLIIAMLVVLRGIFLKKDESFIDTPNDFLIIAMSLVLAAVSADVDYVFHLSGSVSKGIVLFLALKMISVGRRVRLRAQTAGANI